MRPSRRRRRKLRGVRVRRRWRNEIRISDHPPPGDHRKRPGDQGKAEHTGIPGRAEGYEDRDQGSCAGDLQSESGFGADGELSGQGTSAGQVCRLPSGLEEGIRSAAFRREDAGIRTEFVVSSQRWQSLVVSRWSLAGGESRTTNDERLKAVSSNMAIKTYRP